MKRRRIRGSIGGACWRKKGGKGGKLSSTISRNSISSLFLQPRLVAKESQSSISAVSDGSECDI